LAERLTTSPPSSSKVVLSFRPSVPMITSARRFVGDFVSSHFDDPETASRVALTIHELLENTLKYSMDGQAQLDVALADGEGGKWVEVRATNRAEPARVDELRRRIDALRGADDPMELYVSVMRQSAQRDGSGLGLARIVAEGEMDLACIVEGDEVTVKASAPVG
jgi:hypothetical protein